MLQKNKIFVIRLDNNNWYTSNEHTKNFVLLMKDRIGSKVQLSVKGNVIHFIDIIKSNFLTFEINRAVVSLAIKEVNHKVLQDMTKSGNENLKSLDWAILVRKHTESLLSEIKGLHEKSQINN